MWLQHTMFAAAAADLMPCVWQLKESPICESHKHKIASHTVELWTRILATHNRPVMMSYSRIAVFSEWHSVNSIHWTLLTEERMRTCTLAKCQTLNLKVWSFFKNNSCSRIKKTGALDHENCMKQQFAKINANPHSHKLAARACEIIFWVCNTFRPIRTR